MLNSCCRIRPLHLIYFNSQSNFTSHSPLFPLPTGRSGSKRKVLESSERGRGGGGGGELGYGYFLELHSIFFVPVVLQKGRFLMDSNAKIM